MNLLIAIGHIVGSLLTVIVLNDIAIWIALWVSARSRKQGLEEASIRLGVSVDDLYNDDPNNEDLTLKLSQLSSERFSSDLLKNRVSDICGVLRTLWEAVGFLLQVAALISIIWVTVEVSLEKAVYAWIIVVIGVFFWIVSVVFSLICRFLTGRYPGEAKRARKSMAEFLKKRPRGAV